MLNEVNKCRTLYIGTKKYNSNSKIDFSLYLNRKLWIVSLNQELFFVENNIAIEIEG